MNAGFLRFSSSLLSGLFLLFVVRLLTVVLECAISHGPMEFLLLTSFILDVCFPHEHCLHKNSP